MDWVLSERDMIHFWDCRFVRFSGYRNRWLAKAAFAAQQSNRGTVAVQRSDIDIRSPGFVSPGFAPVGQVRVRERAEIDVLLLPLAPQIVQFVQRGRRHFECAPDPV